MSEQLVNEFFNDFPIDYFKIEKEDFVIIQVGELNKNKNILLKLTYNAEKIKLNG